MTGLSVSEATIHRTFQDLDLEENLRARDAEMRAGLLVVDLRTFETPHWVRLGGVVRELYDVGLLAGVRRPMAIGFQSDEIRRYISFPREGPESGERGQDRAQRGEGSDESESEKGGAT